VSGGFFEYDQYRITTIADSIQSELDKQGKEIPREDRWHDEDWYKKYPDDRFYSKLSEETQKEFQNAIKHLRIAAVYAQRIDWFLSGDDGEENFHKRLKEELDKL
jgi:hypothetical protein